MRPLQVPIILILCLLYQFSAIQAVPAGRSQKLKYGSKLFETASTRLFKRDQTIDENLMEPGATVEAEIYTSKYIKSLSRRPKTLNPTPHRPDVTGTCVRDKQCDDALNYFYLAGSCKATEMYYTWMEERPSLALVPSGISKANIGEFCVQLPRCLGGKIPQAVQKIYNFCRPCRADYHQIMYLAQSARTWYMLCERDQKNYYIGDVLSWGTRFFQTKVFLTPDDLTKLKPAKPRICSGRVVSLKVSKAVDKWFEIAGEALENTPMINNEKEVVTVYNRLIRGLEMLMWLLQFQVLALCLCELTAVHAVPARRSLTLENGRALFKNAISRFVKPDLQSSKTAATSDPIVHSSHYPTSLRPSLKTLNDTFNPPGVFGACMRETECDDALNYFYLAGSCPTTEMYFSWVEERQSLALVPAGITNDEIKNFCVQLPRCLGGKVPQTVLKLYTFCRPCRPDFHEIIYLAQSARIWNVLCAHDQSNQYIGDILSWGSNFFRTKAVLSPADLTTLGQERRRVCIGQVVSPKAIKALSKWLEIGGEALKNTPLINSADEFVTVYNRLMRGLDMFCAS
ncbi:hypothetical protein BJ742DRAFT_885943 [Cladochytrium replicatum]|nr:hypothetical protein BJ742DRAFT_885943 [Cladochytrium replicatum]